MLMALQWLKENITMSWHLWNCSTKENVQFCYKSWLEFDNFTGNIFWWLLILLWDNRMPLTQYYWVKRKEYLQYACCFLCCIVRRNIVMNRSKVTYQCWKPPTYLRIRWTLRSWSSWAPCTPCCRQTTEKACEKLKKQYIKLHLNCCPPDGLHG